MSALSTSHPTLLDLSRRLDPNGSIAKLVELLEAQNPILTDMAWQEGNLPTGHKTSVRTGLPAPTWRKIYGFVQPTKSTSAQVTDQTGMLEAYAEGDKALADLNNNAAAFRLSEDRAHIEGMNQEMAQTLFYGNEGTEPEAFTGLAPRFNSLSAQNADNIIDAGGVGSDNTSIWLVVWGENTVHGIIPKGSQVGLQISDKGQVTVENGGLGGGRMEAYRTHYRWDAGLTVRDWRYIVRIANIDVSALTVDGTATDRANAQMALIGHMIAASERIPAMGMGRAVWYMNGTLRTALRQGILAKTSSNLTWDTVEGKRVLAFDDIPVRKTDAIVKNEARVVA